MLDPLFRRVAVATSSVDFMPSFSARKLLINDDRINGVLAVGADGVQREIEAGLWLGGVVEFHCREIFLSVYTPTFGPQCDQSHPRLVSYAPRNSSTNSRR